LVVHPPITACVIDESPNGRSLLTLVLIGAVPFLILVAAHWQYGPLAQFGDWAQYMLHADALRHGRPYGDIGYIFTSRNPFIGPPVQPPGLPVAIVPLLVITNGAQESAAYKLFMLACALAFLATIGAYFLRHGNRALAVATLLVTGLWLEIGFATNAIQPDVGFSAMVWAIFCLADRAGPWTWRRAIAVAALGLAALAFRLAALPLLPAMAVYALRHRREAGARAWTPLLAWCGAGLVAAAAVPSALTFARLVPRNPGILIHGVVESAKVYPFAALDLFLYPLPWNHANDAYHVVVALLAVVGAARWLPPARWRFSVLFAAFYVAMLLVLPMQDGRYLMPLAPLAIYSAGVGIGALAEWAARLTGRAIEPARARSLALGVFTVVVAGTLARQLTAPRPAVLMDAPGVQQLFARLRAARESTTVRAVFMNPRVLTWETGVPAMGFFLASPDTTLAELRARRITHVIVGDLETDTVRSHSIRSAVRARPASFQRLFSEGPFTVYAFDSTRAPHP
jgi:hypothetical protein